MAVTSSHFINQKHNHMILAYLPQPKFIVFVRIFLWRDH